MWHRRQSLQRQFSSPYLQRERDDCLNLCYHYETCFNALKAQKDLWSGEKLSQMGCILLASGWLFNRRACAGQAVKHCLLQTWAQNPLAFLWQLMWLAPTRKIHKRMKSAAISLFFLMQILTYVKEKPKVAFPDSWRLAVVTVSPPKEVHRESIRLCRTMDCFNFAWSILFFYSQ